MIEHEHGDITENQAEYDRVLRIKLEMYGVAYILPLVKPRYLFVRNDRIIVFKGSGDGK